MEAKHALKLLAQHPNDSVMDEHLAQACAAIQTDALNILTALLAADQVCAAMETLLLVDGLHSPSDFVTRSNNARELRLALNKLEM